MKTKISIITLLATSFFISSCGNNKPTKEDVKLISASDNNIPSKEEAEKQIDHYLKNESPVFIFVPKMYFRDQKSNDIDWYLQKNKKLKTEGFIDYHIEKVPGGIKYSSILLEKAKPYKGITIKDSVYIILGVFESKIVSISKSIKNNEGDTVCDIEFTSEYCRNEIGKLLDITYDDSKKAFYIPVNPSKLRHATFTKTQKTWRLSRYTF